MCVIFCVHIYERMHTNPHSVWHSRSNFLKITVSTQICVCIKEHNKSGSLQCKNEMGLLHCLYISAFQPSFLRVPLSQTKNLCTTRYQKY
jgi:hypothetical protein